MRRVVITGIGAVSPLGCGIERVWARLLAGDCGITMLPPEHLQGKEIGVHVAGLVPHGKDEHSYDEKTVFGRIVSKEISLLSQYAAFASDLAMIHAGSPLKGWSKEEKERAGVVLATGGVGSIADILEAGRNLDSSFRKLSPYFVPKVLTNMAGGHVSLRHELRGPLMSPSTACAASSHAVGDAYNLIRLGYADVMLAGGAEACVDPLTMAGFSRMRALSQSDKPLEASRPFDKDRTGFVIAEGACILVLEELEQARKRGANIIAEICGYGMSADAFHITTPSPNGEGAVRSMKTALKQAGIQPCDVGYVNAHATSTPQGDTIELAAVSELFFPADAMKGAAHKERDIVSNPLLISSTKGATGHLLGAAGALELAFTALAVRDGRVPATRNLQSPDPMPVAGLQHVTGQYQERRLRYALKNSFGFGGTNASLVLGEVK
jgi:3-oxoacyl-[acyl-carrier-protein] synthase II